MANHNGKHASLPEQFAQSVAVDGLDIQEARLADPDGQEVRIARMTFSAQGWPVVRVWIPFAILPTVHGYLSNMLDPNCTIKSASNPTPTDAPLVVQLFTAPLVPEAHGTKD